MKKSNIITVAFLGIGIAVLCIRFFSFVSTYSGEALYADQLELYRPFIDNPSLTQLFFYQHGPHRQGMGYILTYLTASLSDWDVRTEALLNAGLFSITCIGFLLLIRRLFGAWHVADLSLPLLFFSLKQYELFTVVPNVSYGVLPFFLSCIAAHLLISTWRGRYVAISIIGVLLLFSGFGALTAILIGIPLLARSVLRHNKGNADTDDIIGLTMLVGGFLLFFYRYTLDTAVSCPVNPAGDWRMYHQFIGSVVANFFSFREGALPGRSVALGAFFWGALTLLFFYYAWRIFQSRATNQSFIHLQFLLLGTTVLFTTGSAIGRTCLGVEAARAGRYVLFLLPGFLALYFAMRASPGRWHRLGLFVFLGLLAWNELLVSPEYINIAATHKESLRAWASCFREHGSVLTCNSLTGFPISDPSAETKAQEIYSYAQRNALNIFSSPEP